MIEALERAVTGEERMKAFVRDALADKEHTFELLFKHDRAAAANAATAICHAAEALVGPRSLVARPPASCGSW